MFLFIGGITQGQIHQTQKTLLKSVLILLNPTQNQYKKIFPSSHWGKKLMHNKFCIIDLYKVIHGSYNWTSNAQHNNESITITDSRTLAEEFSRQFIELYNQKN